MDKEHKFTPHSNVANDVSAEILYELQFAFFVPPTLPSSTKVYVCAPETAVQADKQSPVYSQTVRTIHKKFT